MFRLLKKAAPAHGRIGLSLEPAQIALAVVYRLDGETRLDRCEVLPLPSPVAADSVATALRAAGLPRLPISVVLRTDDYKLALIESPEVPRAELRAAMRWRLKEVIDFPVDEAIIDVFDVPAQSRTGQGKMMYAVAAQRAAVDRYAALLDAVPGLDVVDVPELCLRNLAAALPAAARGVALLHLSDSSATCVLVQGRTFYLSRQMALSAVTVDVEGVVLELQRSLDYYERHFDQPPITRIALSPFNARTESLAADLSRETGFEVAALDLNKTVTCATPLSADHQAACLMAVGTAMREERRTL